MLRKSLFRLTAFLLPFLLILLAEGVCQLLAVAASERTAFTPLTGRETHQNLNPDFVARYFQDFQPGVALTPFQVRKSDDVFRVIVFGGSSAAGYPYAFYNGFPTRLEEYLTARMPSKTVEVVNLAMTAVNSYTVWDLATVSVDLNPDAVVIYAGHNEYYGALGSGSTQFNWIDSPFLKRLTLTLRSSALFTGLLRLFRSESMEQGSRTMMARVVRDAEIPLDGAVYRAGIEQFKSNMTRVLKGFRDQKIPVFMGKVASNLLDQPPLGENDRANELFAEGRSLFQAGDTLAARRILLEAKEMDPLRFRAPESINQLIENLGSSNLAEIIDIQEIARTASTSGIEDASFFTDHLHPNAAGYELIAQAFGEAIMGEYDSPITRPDPDTWISMDPFDRSSAELQINILKAGYPFTTGLSETETRENNERIIRDWLADSPVDKLAALALTTQKDMQEAIRESILIAAAERDTSALLAGYRAILYWQPYNEPLAREALEVAGKNMEWVALALPLARQIHNRNRDTAYGNTRAGLAVYSRHLDEADVILTALEQEEPGSPVMLFNRARWMLVTGDTLSAQAYFQRYQSASRGF